jgi:ubiquitin C-terminal hydrolase
VIIETQACVACGHSSTNVQTLSSLQLQLRPMNNDYHDTPVVDVSLSSCLQHYFMPGITQHHDHDTSTSSVLDVITGVDRYGMVGLIGEVKNGDAYYCDSCARHRDATTTRVIERVPQVSYHVNTFGIQMHHDDDYRY